jgi:hypothetical protein
MATISDLLRDTINVINEITVNSEEVIERNLGLVIARNKNAKASTIERYMTFMNDHIFTKLSKENPLEDLRQLVPLIEKLVVLVSDDGFSLEQALVAAQEVQAVVSVAREELKKPTSFACVLAAGKRILPGLKRLGGLLKSCHGPSSVAVAAVVTAADTVVAAADAVVVAVPAAADAVVVAVPAAADAVVVAVPAAPEEVPQPTEQPQQVPSEAPAVPSHEGHEAEPTPAASDNTDQKEDTAN